MYYSSGVALRLILGTSLVAILAHSVIGEPQYTRNLNYQRLSDVSILPFLLQLRDENGAFLCAGSLIAPQYAITAAECFNRFDFTKAVVVAGATTLTDEGVQRKIAKISKYPRRHINVAVLKLDAPLDKFQAIPLADNTLEEDSLVRLVGWRHLARRMSVTKDLYTTNIKIASQNECETAFYDVEISKLFCLAGDNYDDQLCCADAGGPAIFDGKLYGIVAKGFKCGDPDYLISATSVFDNLSFITDAMQ